MKPNDRVLTDKIVEGCHTAKKVMTLDLGEPFVKEGQCYGYMNRADDRPISGCDGCPALVK